MKTEWTRFTKSFASKRAAKFGVFFIIVGTTLLLPAEAEGVQTGNVQVTCADQQGNQRTFTIGWDNSQAFFDGKGAISRLYCEGGYAGNYRTFISNNLSDPKLDFYNGIAPVTLAPIQVETQTTQQPAPVETPTVVDTPTAPSVQDSPTVTAPPAPSIPDSSTATAPDTQTVVVDSPTAPSVPRSETVTVSTPSDTQTTPVSETPTVIAPSDTSTPISEPTTTPQPVPPVQEPSPTPAPVVSEPVAVVPEPAPVQPEPAPAPVIVPPAPEQVAPPAPEPAPPAPVEPEPAPLEPAPAPVEPAPIPEPAPEPNPVADPPPAPAATPDPIPAPDPVASPAPAPPIDPAPVAPVPAPANPISDPSPAPISILDVNVETLPPETPVELENGVILTAEVVVALQLLENPTELLGAIFTDPGEVFTALSNIGADMSPEVREKSEKVVISAIIAGGIATQAAGIAAASTYRRNP